MINGNNLVSVAGPSELLWKNIFTLLSGMGFLIPDPTFFLLFKFFCFLAALIINMRSTNRRDKDN